MTRVLHIAKDLSLPLEAITSRIGFTGQSESGKTYAATKLAEEMIGVGAQVIAIDPVGPWYGLKMGKDRHTPGLPVVVFGGVHADMPLLPDSGRILAEVLAEKRFSAVLDVSEFTMGELSKFTAAFAEHFFDAKKRNKSPVTIFWEEAQSFAPQELPPDPHAALMLNRVVRVVKVGRNYGIGNVLVTQEPQAVSKRALSQVNCLFMGYMQGDKPRAAVKAWVSDRAKSAADIDLVAELPKLKTGEMFAAEPKWFGPIRKVHIAEKRTFDSSMTPKLGEDAPEPGKLAAVDLRELRAAMASELKQAEADPAFLRARVADLEEQLKRKIERAAPSPKVEFREKHVLKEGQLARVEALVDKKLKIDDAVAAALRELAAVIRPTIPATAFENHPLHPQLGPPPAPKITGKHIAPPVSRPAVAQSAPAARRQSAGELKPLRPTDRRVLSTIVSKPGLTRKRIGVRAGYRPDAGSFGSILYNLRGRALVETRGDQWFPTPAGQAEVPDARALTGEDLRDKWQRDLRPAQWAVLEQLLAAYPNALTRAQLGENLDRRADAGSFGSLIYRLTGSALAEKAGNGFRASEDFFG